MCRNPSATAFRPAASGWFHSELSVSAPLTILASSAIAGSPSRLYFLTIERTLLAVVPKLDVFHVVRNRVFSFGDRHHLVGRHKEKRRIGINKFLDQPRASHSVDLDAFSCNPLHVSSSLKHSCLT